MAPPSRCPLQRGIKEDRPQTRGKGRNMTIGASIFLIAVGAILYWAVTASVAGFSLATAGLILMIAGGVGLVIGLARLAAAGGSRGSADRPA